MQGPAHDGDVGDLLGDRLERGQRPAELLPGPHVRRGERERAGQGAVGQAGGPGQRELIEAGHRAVIPEQVGDGRLIQVQRVLGPAGGAGGRPQPHPIG